MLFLLLFLSFSDSRMLSAKRMVRLRYTLDKRAPKLACDFDSSDNSDLKEDGSAILFSPNGGDSVFTFRPSQNDFFRKGRKTLVAAMTLVFRSNTLLRATAL